MKMRFYSFEPYPFHVVGRCPEPVWPIVHMGEAWRIFSEVIAEYEKIHSVQTHAFVLMSNHYHWLCSVKNAEPLCGFHESVRDSFSRSGPKSFPIVFEEPPQLTELGHIEAYRRTYAYIYKNPVAAGLVSRAELYPFSSLPYTIGKMETPLRFNCWDHMNLIFNPVAILDFINR